MLALIRRLLFGAPLPTARQIHERLPKFLALPIFSSDAVSSVAYGPQEVMITLAIAGSVAWMASAPIGIAIAILVVIVATSYRQTIFAYPHGGGSYTVAKENLGVPYGLVAAASLLTDYVLTVAVSIAAGIDAFISAYPSFANSRIELCVLMVAIVALANLRGLKESGTMFAFPTYGFIVGLYLLIFVGLFKISTGPVDYIVDDYDKYLRELRTGFPAALSVMLILRAFSSGCSALTGIEAIANGIPAFKPPESKNAAITMIWMAAILATLVLGISYLGHVYHTIPGQALVEYKITNIPNYQHLKDQTFVSQVAEKVFGRTGISGYIYYFIQWMTTLILVLAANTAFQDFPRLSSILARDRFAPRQLSTIGDRLVFSNGIVLLGAIAALLLIIFRGSTNALIPLYAVGVFISFTLSQTGMGVRQLRLKHPGWRLHTAISFFGAVITGIVAVVIGITKFFLGAWIVVIVIPTLVFIFHKIHQHYITLGNQLRMSDEDLTEPAETRTTAIVLASGIHKGIFHALKYAKSLSHDCRALYIEIDPSETPLVRERWEKYGIGVPLVILESPYRSIVGPALDYLEEAKKERPNYTVTVVIPEFVPKKWWHKILHNQSALILKLALMFRKDIVVTNSRYYLER